jgi:hypothetical protein
MKHLKIIAVVASLAVLASCTAPDRATRALTEAGYTDIEITGYGWTGCGQDDTFSTKFGATSMAGYPVEGVVCSGLFKGNTIRTY